MRTIYDFKSILLRVKKAKADSGLTNEGLFQKSGVSLGTLNKILSGSTQEPKLPAIAALADALDVSLDYLVFGERKKLYCNQPIGGSAMPSIREEIAKNLLFYRKKKGLTQKELAEKLGVKNTAVSNWESGNNSMDIEMLFRVCEIFGVTLNDMSGKYSVSKSSNLGISENAQKIGAAYDKATPKEQQLVRLTLEEYLVDAPVRVAASSYGEPVDLSAADPDAPFPGDFNPGQDIP